MRFIVSYPCKERQKECNLYKKLTNPYWLYFAPSLGIFYSLTGEKFFPNWVAKITQLGTFIDLPI